MSMLVKGPIGSRTVTYQKSQTANSVLTAEGGKPGLPSHSLCEGSRTLSRRLGILFPWCGSLACLLTVKLF